MFPEVKRVSLAEYCFKKLNDKQIWVSYKINPFCTFTFTINSCNKWVERMGVWAFI